MAFDIRDVLGTVSKTDPGQEQIVYIRLQDLDPDPNNFYTLEGIEDLADNISLIGLQQPIRIRPGTDGHYIVVSGHRRRAACLLISHGDTDNAHMFDNGVPCIIDNDECSPAMRELRLIYANSATRVMTPAEVSKQAERIEAILYQLSEEGVEFKGRMRDHVAKACAVSKSKIARLHAIRKNLVPELLEEFDAGRLNESVAYRMSQEKREVQEELHRKAGISVRGYDINDTERAIGQIKKPKEWPAAASKDYQERWKADMERIRAELEEEDDEFFDMLSHCADDFLSRCYALNGRKEGIERLKKEFGSVHSGFSTDFGYATASPKGLELERTKRSKLPPVKITRSWTEVYDLLCTIALNDRAAKARDWWKKEIVPGSDTKAAASPEWSTGTPAERGMYECRVGVTVEETRQATVWQRLEWIDGGWCFPRTGKPLDSTMNVYRWVRLPEV